MVKNAFAVNAAAIILEPGKQNDPRPKNDLNLPARHFLLMSAFASVCV